MYAYQDLLRQVLEEGMLGETRAKLLSTGKTVRSLAIFGQVLRLDLTEGFPLLTTKRVPFKAVAAELAWFLRGDTNTAYLHEHGVSIWDEWQNETGDLGPIYGKQWRDFGGVDQIAQLVRDIRRTAEDPGANCARRLLVSAWNPVEVPQMALPPCHWAFQCWVRQGALSLMWHQRSVDAFLGLPFNIASYALLTHLLARVTGLGVGSLVVTLGDLHLYENHLDQVKVQLSRTPAALPDLQLTSSVTDLFSFDPREATLRGYTPHNSLPGEVAV